MPWITPPCCGRGNDFDDEGFFQKKVVRRPAKARPGSGDNGGRKPPPVEYLFEARIVRRDGCYTIIILRWPRPSEPKFPMDGARTNLLNDSIVWIGREHAPRTKDDAIAWFFKWAECIVDYCETGVTFSFPHDPDL
jgi:hypothetical protein